MAWPITDGPLGFDEQGLTAAVARQIARFDPKKVRREVWVVIEPVVKAAVAEAKPVTPRDATMLASRTAALMSWCYEQGLDLEPEVVFHPDTIDRFVAVGCAHLSSGSQAVYRGLLRRVGEAFVGAPLYAPRALPIATSDPVLPYTVAEEAALLAWINGLPTTAMREGGEALLALGLGAGLRAQEINTATADWIDSTPMGLVVRVPGHRPRTVPVLAHWAPLAVTVVARSGGGLLFRPERGGVNEKHVSRFVQRLPRSDAPKLSPQRLRATWMLRLLDARVPMNVLAAAAGVEPDRISVYTPFMASVTAEAADRLLRGTRP